MSCPSPDCSRASYGRQLSALVFRHAIRVACLAGAILFVAITINQSANAQIGGLNRSSQRSRFSNRPTVFTGVTRQLLRPLRLAESAIAKRDYQRACLLIGEMLDDDTLQDCIVPDDKEWGYAISLRQKALNLLGTMTEKQRSSYRQKYATRAAQLLEKAIEARDYRGIEFVSDRYLYTDAGLEATVLLGHHWLNVGRPEMSANAFSKLFEIPRGKKLYDPELTLLSAIAYALSKQEETADVQLKRLKELQIKKVEFFEREVSIYADDQQRIEWLRSLIGDSPLKSNAVVNQWLMWQGNPQRNAEAGPGFPLFSPRWSSETLGEYESASALKKWVDSMAKNQVAPVPKTNLLTVGDTIVIRTAEKMMGIDAATGKRRWCFPGAEAEVNGTYSDPKGGSRVSPESIEAGPKGRRHQARQAKFYERILQDTIFSQIASDGKMVFCIPNPGVATSANDWQRYRSDRFESPTDLRKYNEMCGINVAAEGALVWQVGGVSGGDESKLARTFFLGSPLPLDGSLYCICVQDQLVKLVVLDAINGSLQWEKELASTADSVDFTKDVVRRLAGATPSASDGIVVCPTGLNAIVAVDIGARSLKWGFQLSQPQRIPYSRISSLNGEFWKSYEKIWRDTSLKISDGSVVYTPVGSKELCCIDLRTGRSRWGTAHNKPKTHKRLDSIYVAAVRNGEIILVAPGELRGVGIETGQILWKIPFREHGTVSGHGYAQGDSYYLPTTSKKLVRFDLGKGKKSISKVVNTERVLGNLYPWNADIISVGLDHVAAYPCDLKSQQIFDIADANGKALDSVSWKPHTRLAIKAQLELQQGNYPDAARLISEAYDQFPNSSYAGVLVEVLTEMFAVDFKQAEAIFQRYEGLFEQRDLHRLLRGKVNGLVKSERYEEAFGTLLEIANGVEFSDRETIKPGAALARSEAVQLFATEIDLSPAMSSIKQNGDVEISRTSWLRWQLSLLANRVIAKSDLNIESKISREDLVELIAKHLEPFEQEDTETFFRRLQLFPRHLIAPALIVKTAHRLLADQQRIEAKNLLTGDWSDEGVASEVNAQRLEMLGQIAIDQQDGATATALANRLEEENADLDAQELEKLRQQTESLENAIEENIYDDQLYLKLARDRSLIRGPRYKLDEVRWKHEVAQIDDGEYVPFGNGRHNCTIFETDIPEIHQLVFRYEATRGELQIHDSLGRRVRSVYLRPNGGEDSFSAGTIGKIFLKNSVMLLCIGREIFALDWIRMVRGKDPVMWSIRLEHGISSKNAFGGPRASGVCFLDGSELKCVDLFTGQMRWVRNGIPDPSTIKEGGDRIAIWADDPANDRPKIYETFDKLSGRRIAGGDTEKLLMSTSTGHNQFHLFQVPIRSKSKVESSNKPQKQAPDDPFADEAYIDAYSDLRLLVFDFEKGGFAWERTFPYPTIFRQVDETSIAVLTRDGILSLLNLETGKVRFEQQIDGLKDVSALKLAVLPMAQGYVCSVVTSVSSISKVKLDEKTEVEFSELKKRRGWLGKGYIFALERETGKPLWDKPVRIESFGLLDGTPYNSPFLILARRAEYRSLSKEGKGKKRSAVSKPRIQVAMLDMDTGQLKSNHLFKAVMGDEPRCQIICRPGKEYQESQDDEAKQEDDGENEDQNQRLELMIASQRYTIKLAESAEDAVVTAPAVLSNDASVMKLEDELDKVAEGENANLVVDLEPMAQEAQEAYDAMLELGKFESELFEKQRKTRQQQR